MMMPAVDHSDVGDLPTLLYDGDCSFCQNWVAWAKSRGADATVRFGPCQAETDLRAAAHISIEECGQTAMLVGHDARRGMRVHRRARAINGVLRRLPGSRNFLLRVAGLLGNLPLLVQLENVAYRIIARNRNRMSSSCAIRSDGDEPFGASRGDCRREMPG